MSGAWGAREPSSLRGLKRYEARNSTPFFRSPPLPGTPWQLCTGTPQGRGRLGGWGCRWHPAASYPPPRTAQGHEEKGYGAQHYRLQRQFDCKTTQQRVDSLAQQSLRDRNVDRSV
eukprot:964858-Rhodomonas_salina.3